MISLAAYLRIILAETLLLADRPLEAVSHVVLALPVIEKKNLTRELIPAVGLLREAMRRSKADPGVLRQVRDAIHRIKDAGHL